jgi:hypothetical protein
MTNAVPVDDEMFDRLHEYRLDFEAHPNGLRKTDGIFRFQMSHKWYVGRMESLKRVKVWPMARGIEISCKEPMVAAVKQGMFVTFPQCAAHFGDIHAARMATIVLNAADPDTLKEWMEYKRAQARPPDDDDGEELIPVPKSWIGNAVMHHMEAVIYREIFMPLTQRKRLIIAHPNTGIEEGDLWRKRRPEASGRIGLCVKCAKAILRVEENLSKTIVGCELTDDPQNGNNCPLGAVEKGD